jgi:hypothetical protein
VSLTDEEFFKRVRGKKIKWSSWDWGYFIPRELWRDGQMVGDSYTDPTRPKESRQMVYEICNGFGPTDSGRCWILLDEETEHVVTQTDGTPLGAVKHDEGKANMSLLPTSFLKGVTEVLDFGAKKYASHNWRKGFAWSRTYSAALRHLAAWNDGEHTDPESGLSHLKHAACNLAFLIEFEEKKLGKDDRYKPE